MSAMNDTSTVFGGTKNSPDRLESNRRKQDLAMAPTREIVFVDPGVSDIETILGNLRPEVEAILLDPARPAARQITAALGTLRGLDAVHIVAHGAPGKVMFAADEWSVATLREENGELVAIGRALASDGDRHIPCGRRGLGRVLGPRGARAHGRGAAAAYRGGDGELRRSSRCC